MGVGLPKNQYAYCKVLHCSSLVFILRPEIVSKFSRKINLNLGRGKREGGKLVGMDG